MPLFTMQLSEADHVALKSAAKAEGVPMAAYIRRRVFGPQNPPLARVEPARDAREVVRAELGHPVPLVAPVVAKTVDQLATQLAARGIDVPRETVRSRPKVAKEPIKMHRHQASGNGPVPVCVCGAVRASDGFWHLVPDR